MSDDGNGPQRRAGVLGHPIAHSLSPVLHRAAYDELGLDWDYDRYDVTSDDLAGFIDGCGSEWVGLSLTMPLKVAVLDALDEVSALAAVVGAVNTLTFEDGRRVGDNTDVAGAAAAVRLADRGPWGSAAILGGGATARSCLAALGELGVGQAAVYVRRAESGESMRPLAEHVGVDLVVEPWERAAEALLADLVLSTVPAGIPDSLADAVPWSAGTLLDVVYHPWPTPLASAWGAHGGRVATGLDLLAEQAALQVARWTGHPAPIEAMRAAVADSPAAG